MAAADLLNREFLEIRAKLLELAASLDRLDRAAGSVEGEPRMNSIRQALDVLLNGNADHAEQIQLIFSRDYDDDWQQKLNIPPMS
jgi:hypothetical protein